MFGNTKRLTDIPSVPPQGAQFGWLRSSKRPLDPRYIQIDVDKCLTGRQVKEYSGLVDDGWRRGCFLRLDGKIEQTQVVKHQGWIH